MEKKNPCGVFQKKKNPCVRTLEELVCWSIYLLEIAEIHVRKTIVDSLFTE